jgi:IS5 family transposase
MTKFIPFGDPKELGAYIQGINLQIFDIPLVKIGQIMSWELFEPILLEAVLKPAKGPGGRPRFNPLLMFKILVIQKLQGLADDDVSIKIADCHSFKLFLGITPTDLIPNGQTISDFRNDLTESGAFDKLFTVFFNFLQKHGIATGSQGVMIDSSYVEVPIQRNTREQNATLKAGEIPPEFAADPKLAAHKDCDACWAIKGGVTFFGFKTHVKVDVESKIIMDGVTTDAAVHDSQVMPQLVKATDNVVFADSAYVGPTIANDLEAKGVIPQICERGTRNHPLTDEQKQSNREKSKVRSRVEHVFAQITGKMGGMKQRCIGFLRNAAEIKLTNLVYNMLRYEQIKRLNLLPVG